MSRALAWLGPAAIALAACGAVPSVAPGSAPASSAPASPSVEPTAPPCVPGPDGSTSPEATWWADRVFYEVFVRSFADADGDGIGDLRGLTTRLDELNDGDPATTDDLGVTGVWLMPVMPSPSYHGYDVTDYRAIEPDYGTADDFRAFVDAAHERGIAVIVDFPLNHTSSQHPWFVDSRVPGGAYADWYVWADERPPGPGWHRDGERWYFGLFTEQMPDLNLANPEVAAEIVDVARFWLTELDVDGFRLDAAKHLVEDGTVTENTPATHDWLEAFTDAVHDLDPRAMLLGEVFDLSQVSAGYVPEALDLTFDFGLAGATVDSVRAGSAGRLTSALAEVAELERSDEFASFLTNHDQERVASALDGDPASLRLAASLLFTGPGTPFIYYGEEIGMLGEKPDERIRTPMQWDASEPAGGFSAVPPWQPLSDGWPTVNVAAQRDDPSSLRSLYRDLVALRGEHVALRRGSIVPLTVDADGVVATLRSAPDETLLVLANLSDQPVTDYALELGAGPLCGSPTATSVLGADSPVAPVVTPAGGFAGYRPLGELASRSVVVVALAP
jgi:glycosidase